MLWSKVRQIKDNWPTVAAFGLLFLGVFYIVAINSTPEYPYTPGSAIIYPLVVFSHLSVGVFTLVSSILFIPVWIGITTRHKNTKAIEARFLIFIAMGLSWFILFLILLQSRNPTFFVIAALIVLLLLYLRLARLQADSHPARRLFVILGIIILGNLFTWLACINSVIMNMQHKDRALVDQNIYNLAVVLIDDDNTCDRTYILYRCDRFGIVCQPYHELNRKEVCLQQPKLVNVSLKVDQVENAMYIVIDGEQNLVP